MMDGAFGIHPCAGVEKVGTATLHADLCVEGLQVGAGQEGAQVQTAGGALYVIAHQTLVEVGLQRHASCALSCREVGNIV